MGRFIFNVPVSIVLLSLVMIINRINAECCREKINLVPNCQPIHGCFASICADGTPLHDFDSFCGVGRCNIFGCDCEGGCRRNSKGYDEREARKLYRFKTYRRMKEFSYEKLQTNLQPEQNAILNERINPNWIFSLRD